MLQYKINIIEELKKKGYNTYRILKENILNQGTMQALRENRYISMSTIDKICILLDCDVGDILTCVKK